MEQHCGACKWYTPHTSVPSVGVCKFPLPNWLYTAMVWKMNGGEYLRDVHETDGTDCPCYTEKEWKL